jgi:prevent-host-death family protein
MQNTLSTYEAKTHFSSLADRVCAGEEITVTRHGVPVMKLVPIENTLQTSRADRINASLKRLAQLQASPSWPKLSRDEILSLKEEGRKW